MLCHSQLNFKTMNLRFEITMPNNNSWNHIDTGNKGGHFAFRNVDKTTADKLDGKSFYYNFGDGWGANVLVTKNRKCHTNGFRGYEWMIDEILKYGEIKNVDERRFNNKLQTAFKTFIKDFIAENGYIKTDSSFQFEKLHSIFNEEMYASKPSI